MPSCELEHAWIYVKIAMFLLTYEKSIVNKSDRLAQHLPPAVSSSVQTHANTAYITNRSSDTMPQSTINDVTPCLQYPANGVDMVGLHVLRCPLAVRST